MILKNKTGFRIPCIYFSVLKLTCFIPSDVLQKNSAKETKAGSEVKAEMVSGWKKGEFVKLLRLTSTKGIEK